MSDGGLITGLIGGIIAVGLLGGIFWLYYHIFRPVVRSSDLDCKYYLIEELALDEIAKKNGFDLKKEALARSIAGKKSFRKEVERQMMRDFFPEKKK